MAHLDPEQKAVLDDVIARYTDALNALDEDRFIACFRQNCVVRDPVGYSIYHGGDQLRQYIQTMIDTWQAFQFVPEKVFYGGAERVAFTWHVIATARNGSTAQYDGISVVTLRGPVIDGLEAYWDAQAMFEQIKS